VFTKEFAERVWQALTDGRDVILFLPVPYTDLKTTAAPLVEFLRPCGFLQELDHEVELANETWLIIKHKTHFLTDEVLSHLRTRAEVFVL
jgi:hypothetical protein